MRKQACMTGLSCAHMQVRSARLTLVDMAGSERSATLAAQEGKGAILLFRIQVQAATMHAQMARNMRRVNV